jgi:S-adenosylmethionine:tRNA-ribosyltransferase-isomerase (queuine synthetase)
MIKKDSLLSSYDYNLPENLIAQTPSIPAHNAKMMILTPKN